ncbi:MAG: catalase [Lachnospiraceae bacterium]|nr:catalase [Lachnospiraceae bacterium]
MNKVWQHFKTITYHKYLVAKGCFKVGLYRQGLLHDMSKYSPVEFLVGMKYYQGNRSPNNAEREEKGYSAAWLHHKGRNKHHYEYWQDYSLAVPGALMPVPMPDKYFAEMIMDRIAASKVYKGSEYTDSAPLEYYTKSADSKPMHPDTASKLEFVLKMLAQKGEEQTFQYVKDTFVKQKSK